MKHIKHSFFILFIVSFNTLLFSQQRGGGNRSFSQQQGGQRGEMPLPKVNPENMARIIMYDSDEVVKKLKILLKKL